MFHYYDKVRITAGYANGFFLNELGFIVGEPYRAFSHPSILYQIKLIDTGTLLNVPVEFLELVESRLDVL